MICKIGVARGSIPPPTHFHFSYQKMLSDYYFSTNLTRPTFFVFRKKNFFSIFSRFFFWKLAILKNNSDSSIIFKQQCINFKRIYSLKYASYDILSVIFGFPLKFCVDLCYVKMFVTPKIIYFKLINAVAEKKIVSPKFQFPL